MALFATPISSEIRETLDKRQKLQGFEFNNGDTDYINEMSMTPWITIYSNVSPIDNNLKAENYILTGTISDTEGSDVYHSNNLRPKPIITGFTTKNKGSLGSLRSSTLNISCWTEEDLMALTVLYMIPGTSICVQWGWSSMDGQVEEVPYEDREQLYDFKNIKKKRLNSSGMYDALIGMITKFDWSMNEEGGYDIVLELTSLGSEVLSKKLKNCNSIDGENLQDWIVADNSDFINFVKEMADEDDNEALKYIDHLPDLKKKIWELKYYEVNQNWANCHYLNMKAIIDILNYFVGNSIRISLYLENGDKSHGDKSLVKWKDINSNLTYRLMNFNHAMTPPQLALVRNSFGFSAYGDKKRTKTMSEKVLGDIKSLGGMAIEDILISGEWFQEIVSGASTVENIIKSLLSTLNTESLGLWDLQLQIPENGGVLRIIDKNFSGGTGKENTKSFKDMIADKEIFTFNIYSQNSIVHTYSISSKLPDAMKATALYGLNEKGAQDKSQIGLSTLFGRVTDSYLKYKQEKNAKKTGNTVEQDNDETVEKAKEEKPQKKLKTLANQIENGWRPEVVDKEYWNALSTLREGTIIKGGKRFAFDNSDSTFKVKEIGVISEKENKIRPYVHFELSITIKGISGIEYGNLFTVDSLPDRFTKGSTIAFQVKNVSHTVGLEGWETVLEGIMRIDIDKGDGDSLIE